MPTSNQLLLKTIMGIKGLFLTLILFSCYTASSQIIRSTNEYVWLSQNRNITINPYANKTFVGNYPVLDPGDLSLQKYFRTISSEKFGTLFMVIRPKKDSLSDERLLKLGSISLYRDSLVVDGNTILIERIEGKPVIVKVKYQGRAKRGWFARSYHIGNEIDLAELVYYDQVLSREQSRIVESFLGIKYSINITKNSDPKLRDYLDTYGNLLWNSELDSLFDEEVMGLGRMDRIDFFQSQTMTADSKGIKVSLDSLAGVKEMPRISIQDSSLLILSKGGNLLKPQCGGNPLSYFYKLKLFDWVSNAQVLHIEMDTLFHINNLIITDGVSMVPVPIVQSSATTIFEVPLTDLHSDLDYYILGILPPDSCPLLYHLDLHNCDSTALNSLTLHIDSSALPVQGSLVSLSDGAVLDTTIFTSLSKVSNLSDGRYELKVHNQKGMILHSVFSLGNCPSLSYVQGNGHNSGINGNPEWVFSEEKDFGKTGATDGPDAQKDSSSETNDSKISAGYGSLNREVNIYPNPAKHTGEVNFEFLQFDDTELAIQIIDSKGAIFKEQTFIPTPANRIYKYEFPQPGTYLARILSSGYSSMQTIIIQ